MIDWFADKAKIWNKMPGRIEACVSFSERVRKSTIINSTLRVLDFGCGTGLVGMTFLKDVKTVGFLDPSPSMITQVKESLSELNVTNYEVHEGDISTYNGLPYDLIISHMVFHHTENIEETISNLFKNLTKGGKIIICDLHLEDGSFHGDMIVPHFGFDTLKLKEICEKIGFSQIIIEDYPPHIRKKENQPDKPYNRFLLIAEK